VFGGETGPDNVQRHLKDGKILARLNVDLNVSLPC
jgi:hypothetical protein